MTPNTQRIALAALMVVASFVTMPVIAADGTAGINANGNGTGPVDVSGGDATDGGTGGQGGNTAVATTQAINGPISVKADGGAGGDTTSAGAAGTGGNAGNIALSVNNPVNGEVFAAADGGHGGTNSGTGSDGTGGSGGNVAIDINAPVNGDVVAVAAAGKSASTGTAGNVSITVAAPVAGGVNASVFDGGDQSTGSVVVTLKDGASVGTTIQVNPEVVDSTLAFNMTISNKAAFDAANAALASASADSGTATINGQTFTWQGFKTIQDLLSFIGQMEANRARQGSVMADTRYLACRPGTVIAYRALTGIVFNAKEPDSKAFFHVGDMDGDAFKSANPLGWTVAFTAAKPRSTYQVLDKAGGVVASCKG